MEFIKAIRLSDNTVVTTMEEAQHNELAILFGDSTEAALTAQRVMANKAKVMDILTTTPSSLPSARKINGGRKPRKKVEAPAQVGGENNG